MTLTDAGIARDPVRKGPGRPRSARVDLAITTAVLDLLAEGVTAESLSIEAVAARAGVGKATIYRRWPNKDALLFDAITALKGQLPEIRGVSVREDLITLLKSAGRMVATPTGETLPGLISCLVRSPELNSCFQRVVEPRRERIREVLRRGMRTGELRAGLDLDAVLAMLVAPLAMQRLVPNWSPSLGELDRLPERLVEAVWPAICAG